MMGCENTTARQRASVLLNEQQVAEMLCVSLPTLRRWRHRRVGPPFIKLSALCRYSLEQLEAWLAGLAR